jgi:hypothetical protein
MRKYLIALVGVGVLGVLLYFSGFMEGFVSDFEEHPGLPSCDSSHGQSDAKRAIENGPFAKANGINVIALTEAKKISASAQKVECTAIVILNTATKGVINYSFTNDPSLGGGQYFIQAALDLPSFKPYP